MWKHLMHSFIIIIFEIVSIFNKILYYNLKRHNHLSNSHCTFRRILPVYVTLTLRVPLCLIDRTLLEICRKLSIHQIVYFENSCIIVIYLCSDQWNHNIVKLTLFLKMVKWLDSLLQIFNSTSFLTRSTYIFSFELNSSVYVNPWIFMVHCLFITLAISICTRLTQ